MYFIQISPQEVCFEFFHVALKLIPFEEFVLRSLSASPLTKPFFTPTGWHVVKNSVVKRIFLLVL